MKKKVVKIIAGLTVLVIAAVLLVPLPFHRTFDALEIKLDDPSYAVPREIAVDGCYCVNLLTDSIFDGSITVSDYALSEDRMHHLNFSADYAQTGAGLWYQRGESDPSVCLGILHSGPFLSNPCVYVLTHPSGSKDTTTEDAYCIVSGADSREEALQILRRRGMINAE